MAVLIDPPSWPAHGTEFSHLVSTSSLAELHAFAAAAGISRRAFDEDHYDVPARRYRELLDRGALPVSGGELVRALLASGLRIPARRRAPRLRTALVTRWDTLLPGVPDLGAELLDRWGEPRRRYHTPGHLLAVLEALDRLLEPADASLRRTVLLAAWFHDAVYQGVAGEDERASAAMAGDRLQHVLQPNEVQDVQRLVLLTASHDPSVEDRSGALLCDADLSVLGGSPEDYHRYATAVRAEYAHVPESDFRAGRRAVLQRLMVLDPLYRTVRAQTLWADAARRNLLQELASLGEV
jgi:predicted metal-dependent HD superfamily phosphohydrolase